MKNNITINAQGTIGDTLFSTYLAKAIYKKYNKKIDYRFQYGTKRSNNHPTCENGILKKSAYDFIISTFQNQQYINSVEITDIYPDYQVINLCDMYNLPINWRGDNIINYAFYLVNDLLYKEYWVPSIKIETKNNLAKDKVLVSRTDRYLNPYINYKELQRYKDQLIFIGTEQQHTNFCKEIFKIEYIKCNTLLEIGELMNSCKFYIGNQGGLFTLAECMKIPRLLLSPSYSFEDTTKTKIQLGPTNNCPIGGICEIVIENNKFKAILPQIFN